MIRRAILILILQLIWSTPLLSWEAREVERPDEQACVVIPEDASFAVEMAEVPNQQRRTRVFIYRAEHLAGSSRYFIAIDTGEGVETSSGMIEGRPAADLVYAMLESRGVRLGVKDGVRPPKDRHWVDLDGFREEFWTCMQLLGWDGRALRSPDQQTETGEPDKEPKAEFVTVRAESDEPGSPTPEISVILAEYRSLLGQKALAVSAGSDGSLISGSASAATTIEEAIAGALAACTETSTEQQGTADCSVYMVGDAIIGRLPTGATGAATATAHDEAEPATVTYDTRWVEGRQFVVGTARDAQIWTSFSTEGGPHAFVYLVNAGSSQQTFLPEEVRATAVRRSRAGDLLEPMHTFGAEEYEQKEQRQKALIGALYGVATAFANLPAPSTSTVQGWTQGRVSAFGSGGYVVGQASGSFYGTVTTWPTARDHAEARARTSAQIAAMNAQLQASFDAMAQTLARRHTLPSGTYYGGIVRFRKERGHEYRLRIPFAGHVFEATFDVR
jgi:hypothetical protein